MRCPTRRRSPSRVRPARRMRDFILEARKRFEPTFENLHIEEVHKGTQAFVLWKNKQYAAHRRTADFGFLEKDANELPEAADREQYIAACQYFCRVFPDAFTSPNAAASTSVTRTGKKGRLLSAGFHSMMGYFRDDQPLHELILDERGQRELDALWQELDFFTSAPMRQYQGFLWFDRTDSRFMRDPEFDFARPEDKASLSQPMIERLSKVYLAKAKANGGEEVPLQAIDDYFREINEQIRSVEQARIAAEPHHLDAVIELAARAYRRPLTSAEAQELAISICRCGIKMNSATTRRLQTRSCRC